jgi:hypothetical protein
VKKIVDYLHALAELSVERTQNKIPEPMIEVLFVNFIASDGLYKIMRKKRVSGKIPNLCSRTKIIVAKMA